MLLNLVIAVLMEQLGEVEREALNDEMVSDFLSKVARVPGHPHNQNIPGPLFAYLLHLEKECACKAGLVRAATTDGAVWADR